MFNWPLFIILLVVSIPGILLTLPTSLRLNQGTVSDGKKKKTKKTTSSRDLAIATLAQSLIMVGLADAVGVSLAPDVGLGAPFFEALVTPGTSAWAALQPQLVPALGLGVIAAMVLIALYYGIFRPRLDAATLRAVEALRVDLGMAGRILYGGIVEEVLTRWGLMTLVVWAGAAVFGQANDLVMWLAILISGILFGLGHLPGVLAAGAHKSRILYISLIVVNLCVAIFFGWLYWQYGLAAAMIAHMLVHAIWHPFDLWYARRDA